MFGKAKNKETIYAATFQNKNIDPCHLYDTILFLCRYLCQLTGSFLFCGNISKALYNLDIFGGFDHYTILLDADEARWFA